MQEIFGFNIFTLLNHWFIHFGFWAVSGRLAQPLLHELVSGELLLSQLRLLVDLSQHLVHHAEQRTAQAQQLIQEHIVMWVAPDVRPHSCERLTHTSKQPSRQHTHSPASTPRPAQASPKQGNQGTWGLDLDAARCRVGPTAQGWGCDTVILHKPRYTWGNNEIQHEFLLHSIGTRDKN